jgi:hypothetical protein
MAAASYSEDVAKAQLEYASASYCPRRDAIVKWSCRRCTADDALSLKNVAVVDHSRLQLRTFVGERPHDGSIVVSFRGTVNEDIMNWIKDASIIGTSVSHCYRKRSSRSQHSCAHPCLRIVLMHNRIVTLAFPRSLGQTWETCRYTVASTRPGQPCEAAPSRRLRASPPASPQPRPPRRQ